MRKLKITHNFQKWSHRHFFDVVLFPLSSLVTGSSFMSISSLVLELWHFSFMTRNPKIGNTSVCVLPNIWGVVQLRNTKFGPNVSNKKLQNDNDPKCHYNIYRFWVIKGKPITGVKYPTSILRLKRLDLPYGDNANDKNLLCP